MTVSSAAGRRAARVLLGAVMAALPTEGVLAWQQPPPPPPAPPRPVVILLPSPGARFEQSMRQQQIRDQLQKNQAQEQLRQRTMDALRRPATAGSTGSEQLDQAELAQRALYRARQRGMLDRYQEAVAPPIVVSGSQPAPARSVD